MKKSLFILFSIFSLLLGEKTFAAISGWGMVCMGTPRILCGDTTITTAATWSSSNVAVATVAPTGTSCAAVTGVSVGTAIITCTQGSTVSTLTVTVNPSPTAITGSLGPICVGTTTSLSCTSAGGTWSSSPSWVASVGSLTGVVTGVGGGTATIYYTLSTGCSSTAVVTVTGTPAVDSVMGASSVCAGATTTYTCITSGGVWSSSNPSVATVSSSGVVTGVTVGTAIISYSVTGGCGTGHNWRMIAVTTGTSTGTITGTTTVGVGLTTTLSSTVGGGTWSSASTAVASVSLAGVVTGVAVGTTVITYSVTGCSGAAFTTTTVTVTAANCISGDVLFTGASYTGNVKVWLIKYNPTTLMLTAADSLIVTSTGASAHYVFCGMSTDSFRVKAAAIDTMLSGTTTGYQPTYHTASAFWSTATVINHTSGTHDMGKNITMGYGTVTSGPGFIAGDVTMGANKGSAGSVPAVNMLMYCINNTTGAIMQKTYTNASGHYTFSSLPVGQSYKIYPEMINYATTPYPPIALTSSASSMTAAHFEQHTLSHTITPIVSSVNDNTLTAEYVSVYPNPASGVLNVQWSINKTATGNINITDMAGRSLIAVDVDMNAGTGTRALSLTGIAPGIYAVRISADGFTKNVMIQVQ